MKKNIKITDIDCPSCALKLESEIKKVKGVSNARIGFLSQNLELEYDEGSYLEIIKNIKKACKNADATLHID